MVALKRPVSDAARGYLEQMDDDKWLDHLWDRFPTGHLEYPSRRAFRFWQPGAGFDHNVFREKTVPAVRAPQRMCGRELCAMTPARR